MSCCYYCGKWPCACPGYGVGVGRLEEALAERDATISVLAEALSLTVDMLNQLGKKKGCCPVDGCHASFEDTHTPDCALSAGRAALLKTESQKPVKRRRGK